MACHAFFFEKVTHSIYEVEFPLQGLQIDETNMLLLWSWKNLIDRF